MTKYNVDHQYQAYLQRMGLPESLETRRAFYGGWGQLLAFMKTEPARLSQLQLDAQLTSMETQVEYFFEIELENPMGYQAPPQSRPTPLPPLPRGIDDSMIYAPFTPEQVVQLNAYQQSGKGHPFTGLPQSAGRKYRSQCPDGECRLIAQESGWVCPCGSYTQDWAPSYMTQ